MSDDTILLKSDRILGYYGIQPDELKELLKGQYQGHNTLQDVETEEISDKEMKITLHFFDWSIETITLLDLQEFKKEELINFIYNTDDDDRVFSASDFIEYAENEYNKNIEDLTKEEIIQTIVNVVEEKEKTESIYMTNIED